MDPLLEVKELHELLRPVLSGCGRVDAAVLVGESLGSGKGGESCQCDHVR
jgi:hypothetical protein